MPRSRTKIVCTVGPASSSPAVLEAMARAGMDVARLNFSHGTPDGHRATVATLRDLSERIGRPIAVLQDLAGPKIRVGALRDGHVTLTAGATFVLAAESFLGDASRASTTYPALARDVEPGDALLLADGSLELSVRETRGDEVVCDVVVGGELGQHQGITLPNRSIRAPCLTDKDRDDLALGLELDVDWVALSFVRDAADVLGAREFMEARGKCVPIVAKIEKHEALANIDGILDAADGLMVARGDLGVETRLETVPLVQKRLIDLATRAGKPVITATQMLQSMVTARRPTRAEVADVANAILDGTDAIMLSAETAVGEHPTLVVETMSRIARHAETGMEHERWLKRPDRRDVAGAVAAAACDLADTLGAAALITFTKSGLTARMIARYRPDRPILAPTPVAATWRRLALVWGVVPILTRAMDDTDAMVARALEAARSSGLVHPGQTVVITAGVPLGKDAATNMIKAEVLPADS